MNAEQSSVLEYLKSHAFGRANAKTADQIQLALALPSGRTQEPLRELIRKMVNDEGVPIGSASNGYFFISNEEELEDAINNLEGRARRNIERADSLRRNWRNMKG